MTLKLPQRKVAAIIRQSLQAKPQSAIAEKEGVDQSTVSLWWSRFKERSEQVGLSAAGKEFGVYNEVDELKSLSVELDKAGTSVQQAREGAKISQAFADLGIAPERHAALVKVCREIDNPGFVEAACQLVEIEDREGIGYEEAPVKLKQTAAELRGAKTALEATQSELGTKQQELAKAKRDLANVKEQLAAARESARSEEAALAAQLETKTKELRVKQAEMVQVAQIKRDLAQHNLGIPALVAVAGEFGQGREVDAVKLGQAINEFGSLGKANDSCRRENETLTKDNGTLREERANLQAQKNDLLGSLKVTQQKLQEENQRLSRLSADRTKLERQHDLFDGWVAMLATSPSLGGSLEHVKRLIATLSSEPWQAMKPPEELRSLFVRTIMGDFLRCSHCDYCNASFLVNKEPYRSTHNFYMCPACHCPRTRANDSFLKAMVSDKQLENVRLVEQFERENRVLQPFKAFLESPCVVCGQPVNEWSDDLVQSVMKSSQPVHPQCRNTLEGQPRMSDSLRQFFQGLESPLRTSVPWPKLTMIEPQQDRMTQSDMEGR